MGGRVIGGCALAALVVVPAAILQTVVGQTIYRAVDLQAGTSRALSLSCPPGSFAVSAGISKASPGVTMLGIRLIGLRTFALRLSDPPVGLERRVTVAAACRRLQARSGSSLHLRLTPLGPLRLRVGPARFRQVRLGCPDGTVPAAAGYDLGGRGSQVILRQQTQTLRGLTFGVFNRGSAARSVSFYGSCLTVVRPPGARGARLEVQLATDTVSVQPGTQVVTRLCPRGWLSLAAGYALTPGLAIDGAAAVARAGRWSLTSTTQAPAFAQLELVCARLG
jgi:hypothetical protein